MEYSDLIKLGRDVSGIAVFSDSAFPRKEHGYDEKLRYQLLGNLYSAIKALQPEIIFVPIINQSIIQVLPIINDAPGLKVALLPSLSLMDILIDEDKKWLSTFCAKNVTVIVDQSKDMGDLSSAMKKTYEHLEKHTNTFILFRKTGGITRSPLAEDLAEHTENLIIFDYAHPLFDE